LLLFAIEFLGVLALETKGLGWQRLEDRGFGERPRPSEFLIYSAGKEIVAGDRGAYPKEFGKWRNFLCRTVAESFGTRFDWLKFGCVAVGLFFKSDAWLELPNESSKDYSSK
jgi:hypothetical protein